MVRSINLKCISSRASCSDLNIDICECRKSYLNFACLKIAMINSTELFIESLGSEPIEIFGFSSEEELDRALFPLMQEMSDTIKY